MHEQPQIPQYKLTLNLASVGTKPARKPRVSTDLGLTAAGCRQSCNDSRVSFVAGDAQRGRAISLHLEAGSMIENGTITGCEGRQHRDLGHSPLTPIPAKRLHHLPAYTRSPTLTLACSTHAFNAHSKHLATYGYRQLGSGHVYHHSTSSSSSSPSPPRTQHKPMQPHVHTASRVPPALPAPTHRKPNSTSFPRKPARNHNTRKHKQHS